MNWLILTGVSLLVFASSAFATGGGSFDQEPPTLPFYLHRLPAKTLEQIYDETAAKPKPWEYLDVPLEVSKLGGEIHRNGAGATAAKIDELLVAIRPMRNTGHYSGGALFNLLYDLRDAASIPHAPLAELENYFAWRIKHAEWFGLATRPGATPEPRWIYNRPKLEPDQTAEIDQQVAKASPALRPQWIFLQGALLFKAAAEDTKSRAIFASIVDRFPQHPRAETAAFMVARCALSQSRSYPELEGTRPVESDPNKRREALNLFRNYLAKYPHGRFVADVTGWLGAIAFDADDYAEALRQYIAQSEMPDHPELRSPALEMCERVLSHIASKPNDESLAEVARHPRTAIALLYLIVNSTEADNFDGKYDEVERVKGWRKNILPRFAKAVGAGKTNYAGDGWPARHLAILALAASGAGHDDEALSLTQSAATAGSDDLLFARAVALQRAARLPEAISALRDFLLKFPRSPVAAGVRLRLALALQDDHHAGRAIVQLLALDETHRSRVDELEGGGGEDAPEAYVSDAEPAQVRQLITTMLAFAPLPELAEPLTDAGLDPTAHQLFTDTLVSRHLAREDFAAAKRYVTPAAWSLHDAKLEALTAVAASAKTATAWLQLGDEWARQHGKLLALPALADNRGNRTNGPTLAMRENARALYRDIDPDGEMEAHEELRHATACWLRAADAAPASAGAAVALWRALRAIPEIAGASEYAAKRALETNAAGKSREFYERLRGECPSSREAKEFAVFWDFAADNAADNYRANFVDAPADFGVPEILGTEARDHYATAEEWKPVLDALPAFAQNATDEPALLAALDRLEAQASQLYRNSDEAPVVNFLADIRQFLKSSKTTAELRKIYLPLRLEALHRSASAFWYDFNGYRGSEGDPDNALREKIHAARARPEMKSVADFLDFLDLAVVANHFIEIPVEGVDKDGEPLTYRERDYGLVERLSDEFLARYPTSAKREAATLLHARAIFLRSRPHQFSHAMEWRKGSDTMSAPPPQFHQQEPFDSKRVLRALDQYDRAFPHGKFATVIRSYRSEVAARMRDWPQAAALALAQLDGDTARDADEEAREPIRERVADEQEVARFQLVEQHVGPLRLRLHRREKFQRVFLRDHVIRRR